MASNQEPAESALLQSKQEPTLSISAEMKINLGNYNSAAAFVSMSNLTAETTEEQMDRLLANGRLVWEKLRADLSAKVTEIKQRRLGDD